MRVALALVLLGACSHPPGGGGGGAGGGGDGSSGGETPSGGGDESGGDDGSGSSSASGSGRAPTPTATHTVVRETVEIEHEVTDTPPAEDVDGDGLAGLDDTCPWDAEDQDGDRDDDGCPDRSIEDAPTR
jgi:hypothetical protein